MVRTHVVSYDVRCPKRWRRVFGLLKRRGVHRQLSVFLVKLDIKRMALLEADLLRILDPVEDSLLVVRIDAAAGGMKEFGIPVALPGARITIV